MSERLLYSTVALETVLLRNETEPIQSALSDRVAFLVTQELEGWLAVAKDVKRAYGLRSRFVHHGVDAVDSEVVSRFLLHSWLAIWTLIHNAHRFEDANELADSLDRLKFGGGRYLIRSVGLASATAPNKVRGRLRVSGRTAAMPSRGL